MCKLKFADSFGPVQMRGGQRIEHLKTLKLNRSVNAQIRSRDIDRERTIAMKCFSKVGS